MSVENPSLKELLAQAKKTAAIRTRNRNDLPPSPDPTYPDRIPVKSGWASYLCIVNSVVPILEVVTKQGIIILYPDFDSAELESWCSGGSIHERACAYGDEHGYGVVKNSGDPITWHGPAANNSTLVQNLVTWPRK